VISATQSWLSHEDFTHAYLSFRTYIAAARKTGLPLVFHSREADADNGSTLSKVLRHEYPKRRGERYVLASMLVDDAD
jgi:Tat protein secretion system quality control protein TatD with DNase activity